MRLRSHQEFCKMQLWKAKELQVVCQSSPQAPITVFFLSIFFFFFSGDAGADSPARDLAHAPQLDPLSALAVGSGASFEGQK